MPVSAILAATDFGPYISWWKVLVLLVVIFVWAKLLAWADKDAVKAHLPRQALNASMLGGFIFAFLLFIMLPGFGAAISVFLFIFLAEVAAYLVLRNQKIGLADLKKEVSKTFGGKKRAKKAAEDEEGGIQLINKKGATYAPPDPESPDQAAYVAALTMLTDPLRRNAEKIEMRPTDGAATVKYLVDGVLLDGRSIAKDDANAAVQLLKQLAGMDLNDRRKPQSGSMKVMMDGRKRELTVNTAGTTAGETIAIDVDAKAHYELTIDQLGFSNDQLNTVEEIIAEGQGIVLLAAPRGHGLTSLMYALLKRHDAFLSHIQTIERDPKADLEGVTQNKIPAGSGEEAKQVAWLASQQPDVLAVDRVEDPKSAVELANFAASGRRAYVGLRAGSTFEALQMWRNMIGDDRAAMKDVRLVIAARLVRKLCTACKQDFNPDPDTLRKLNMAPERVGKLFTARTTPLKDNRGRDLVCEFCLDLRFRGRIGVYELFLIDDEVKQVVQAGGSVNQLKMLFKKQRQKYLQEQALAVAVAGESSLNEVARVLKVDAGGGASPSSAGRKPTSPRA